MKLHLPRLLASALLVALVAVPAYSSAILDDYENQVPVYHASQLSSYSPFTSTDYYAFLLGMDIEVTSDIRMEGGNLCFTTYAGQPPVSLEFSGDGASALSNQTTLVFDTLSRLSFSDLSDRAVISGDLIIRNVNDGVDDSESPDVSFTGTKYSGQTVSIIDNGDVSFVFNSYSFYAISTSKLSIIGNGNVSFTGKSGGAIYASSVTISGNGDVNFTDFSESSYGAIYTYGALSISDNGNVSFSGNGVDSSPAQGGAIRASNVSISGNDDVIFSANTTYTTSPIETVSYGGAIYAYKDVVINGNGDVNFSANTASCSPREDVGESSGGAIYASNDVVINGNGDVNFSDNTATFNSLYSDVVSFGGAIYATNVSIKGNRDVTFTGNSSSYSVRSLGGAIFASSGVSINGNKDVTFTGNFASAATTSSSSIRSLGGAIHSSGYVSISGNETVCFEQNYERENSTYRLRSIHTFGNLNLSAKTGGHITFYDSVYGGTTELNAGYTDAEGKTQQAKGDIIFSGLYTKTHLDAILEANNEGRVATDAEILNSRTSTLGSTMLYGGLLQVVDGAILSTSSLTVAAGSSAGVLLRDAGLNGTLRFGTDSSLELQGANTTTGSLTLGDEVSLSVTLDNSHLETAALTLTGSVSTGTLSLNLNVADERASGMYRILSAGNLATEASWTAENVSVQGSGAAAGAGFGDLVWQDGVLYYAASPVWSNHSGSMVWSSTDTNWNNGSTFRAGQDVIFMDRGAGEVQLVGELTPASILVQNTEGNDYAFTGSGKLSGNTSLTKTGAGELTIATANDYTGRTELQEGTLNVHHSTALGATATGEASLTAAAGTTLKVGNSSHLVLAGCNNSLSGAVEVADGATLEMKGSGYAATSSTVNGLLAFTGTTASTGTTTVNGSLVFTDTSASMGTTTVNGTLAFTGTSATSGTLSGSGTVLSTDSQVTVENISGFTGNLKVEGKGAGLSIGSGNYTGTGTLSVSGGTLTFGAKGIITLNEGGLLALQSREDAVASVTASNINVNKGAVLAASAGASKLGETPEISSHELSVDLNCAFLTLNAGATLAAEDACFDLNNGLLILAVRTDSTEKIELVLAEHSVYTGSEQIALFTNVGQGVFVYDGITTNTGSESLYTLNAADYFTGNGISTTTKLVYDSTTGCVYLEGVATVPEPTTATLSLLALAGLCARRRRRK